MSWRRASSVCSAIAIAGLILPYNYMNPMQCGMHLGLGSREHWYQNACQYWQVFWVEPKETINHTVIAVGVAVRFWCLSQEPKSSSYRRVTSPKMVKKVLHASVDMKLKHSKVTQAKRQFPIECTHFDFVATSCTSFYGVTSSFMWLMLVNFP